MKRETGRTNLRQVVKKVSIQLALDGHSFSIVEEANGQAPAKRPEVEKAFFAADEQPERKVLNIEVVTPRTLLVPEPLYADDRAADLLAADGKHLRTNETAVVTPVQSSLVAVIAVPVEALRQLRETYGEQAEFCFSTPLLSEMRSALPTCRLQLKANHLFVKLFDTALYLAEVIPAPGDADILFAIDRIGSEFPPESCALRLVGRETHRLAKLFGRRYRSVQCE